MKIDNLPLFIIITAAYDIPFNSFVRLSGVPDWTQTERYDIEATPDKSALPPSLIGKARIRKMREMLQNLLVDRFHMKIRTETRDLPVYVLLTGKGGPKLKPANIQEKDCPDPTDAAVQPSDSSKGPIPCHQMGGGQGRGLHGKAIDTADMARFIENWTDRPVIDKTALSGLYEVDTEGWTPMRALPGPPREAGAGSDEGLNDPERHTLFTVLDRLGLKLDSQRGPVQVYVIEHIEKLSEN